MSQQPLRLQAGLALRLPSGNVVRLLSKNAGADHYWSCGYLGREKDARHRGVTLRTDWLQRYGRVAG